MTTVTDTPEPQSAPREINLNELYQELARQLHEKEQECAEIRGQLKLIERLAQQPQPNDEPPRTRRGKPGR